MKECRRQNFVLLNLRLPFEFEAVFLDFGIMAAIIDATVTNTFTSIASNYARTTGEYLSAYLNLANICQRLNIYLFHNRIFFKG